MKHKIQRILASLLLIFLSICSASAISFPDVDEYSEYWPAIEFISEMQIMVGDDQGNFNPYKTVTRAEMAIIVCKLKGSTDNLETSAVFSDVPISHWANTYISKAAELGIVSGYGNGIFGPSDLVTYEQAVTMIVQAVGDSEAAMRYGGYPDGFLATAKESSFLEGVFAEKGEPLSRSDIAMIAYNYSMTLG